MTDLNPLVAGGAGGMIATLDDLRAWLAELVAGTLLRPDTPRERLRFHTIPDAGDLLVGYGLGIADFDGLLGHNGAIYGYSSAAFVDTRTEASIVVLGNQAGNEFPMATEIALQVAAQLR